MVDKATDGTSDSHDTRILTSFTLFVGALFVVSFEPIEKLAETVVSVEIEITDMRGKLCSLK